MLRAKQYTLSWRHTLADYDNFFIDNPSTIFDDVILVLNSTYFSRPDTRLINRGVVPMNIGIREIYREPDAYASHQMFSEWVPKKED